MTRAIISDKVAQRMGIPGTAALKVVNSLLDIIAEELCDHDKVTLRGFGVFTAKLTKARIGRNPRNGAQVAIPARRMPRFKPAKELVQYISNGKHGG